MGEQSLEMGQQNRYQLVKLSGEYSKRMCVPLARSSSASWRQRAVPAVAILTISDLASPKTWVRWTGDVEL